jgi:uncharacterized repeat protein (TIGR04076 family)
MPEKKPCVRKKDYVIEIIVDSVKGKCPLGIKKGDRWLIDTSFTPSKFCMNAFGNVFPVLRTFRYGGEHRWDIYDKDVTYAACPDFRNQVIYKLTRFPLNEDQ